MKKLMVSVITLTLLLPVFSIYGSEEERVMKLVSCPEQNFSTVCRPECTYDYTPDGGLTIYLGENEDDGIVTIFKTDAPGSNFDAEYYLNNVYVNLLETSYGDDLLDPGEYTIYPFAGRELPGRMALYIKDGTARMRFCLYDLQDDYFVRYEAFSIFDETAMQSAVDDMSDAIRYFQPDASFYSNDNEDTEPEPETETQPLPDNSGNNDEAEAGPVYQIICCPEQWFSTKCRYIDRVEFKDYQGVTAFIPEDDITIWVRVWNLGYYEDFDAETYFKEEVTPSMRSIYEENSYGEGRFTSYEVSGKEMWGKEYLYTVRGNDYTRRVMVTRIGDDIVRFEAAFTEESYDKVMVDLEYVVEFYQPDPYYYGGGDSEPSPEPGPTSDPAPVPEDNESDVDLDVLADWGIAIPVPDGYSAVLYGADKEYYIFTEEVGYIPYVMVCYYSGFDSVEEACDYLIYNITDAYDDLKVVGEPRQVEYDGKYCYEVDFTYSIDGFEVLDRRILAGGASRIYMFVSKEVAELGSTVGSLLEDTVDGSILLPEYADGTYDTSVIYELDKEENDGKDAGYTEDVDNTNPENVYTWSDIFR